MSQIFLLLKYPCVINGDSFTFTDYANVYMVQADLSHILALDIMKIEIDNNELKIKVPLAKGSKMLKTAQTLKLTVIDKTVEDFMMPLLHQGSNTQIKIFLQVIKDIRSNILNGNPMNDLLKKLEDPSELLRLSILANIENIKNENL
eukprot:NODE_289_length_11662_cov_0.555133.p6 type:complete len:147 gc:universal NODE_289_length_11662_cov_0.555133:3752-4192(+)